MIRLDAVQLCYNTILKINISPDPLIPHHPNYTTKLFDTKPGRQTNAEELWLRTHDLAAGTWKDNKLMPQRPGGRTGATVE